MARIILVLTALLVISCQSKESAPDLDSDIYKGPGWVSIFQTATSKTQTTINILRPRLLKAKYYVLDSQSPAPQRWDGKNPLKVIKTVKGPKVHWQIDRVVIDKLSPGKNYHFYVVNSFRKKTIDWRRFSTVNLDKKHTRFAVGSCMSDSYAYTHVRDRIWQKMIAADPDFIMLLGDQVYVDDFDYVIRNKVSKFDIWMRYIDSLRKIPLFKDRQLKPLLAVWDDHDYGTNNSDKTFATKKEAKRIFEALFGGFKSNPSYHPSPVGVSFSFNGFGQKFLMMDNRYDRSSKKKDPHGQWGQRQHQWFLSQVEKSHGPVWLANGGQFFARATVVQQKSGKKKQVNESFIDDHPVHFKTLISELKKQSQPVVFLSGDIHYSEITRIEKDLLSYETYEITSSPLHSYIYRSRSGKESWLNNPRRLVSVKEHNFLIVDSSLTKNGLDITVESIGIKQQEPYFKKVLKLRKE